VVSGRWLTPVVGLQRGPIELRSDDFEIAEWFHVDIATSCWRRTQFARSSATACAVKFTTTSVRPGHLGVTGRSCTSCSSASAGPTDLRPPRDDLLILSESDRDGERRIHRRCGIDDEDDRDDIAVLKRDAHLAVPGQRLPMNSSAWQPRRPTVETLVTDANCFFAASRNCG